METGNLEKVEEAVTVEEIGKTLEENWLATHEKCIALEEESKVNIIGCSIKRGEIYTDYCEDHTQTQCGDYFGVDQSTVSDYKKIYDNRELYENLEDLSTRKMLALTKSKPEDDAIDAEVVEEKKKKSPLMGSAHKMKKLVDAAIEKAGSNRALQDDLDIGGTFLNGFFKVLEKMEEIEEYVNEGK